MTKSCSQENSIKLGVKDVIKLGSDDGIKDVIKLGLDDEIKHGIKHGIKLVFDDDNEQL